MTCAKRHVECRIAMPDGRVVVGTNACTHPQEACPRLPGEGYQKCRDICGQIGHAERVALWQVGDCAEGAVAFVVGHNRVCGACRQALYDAGVRKVEVVKP